MSVNSHLRLRTLNPLTCMYAYLFSLILNSRGSQAASSLFKTLNLFRIYLNKFNPTPIFLQTFTSRAQSVLILSWRTSSKGVEALPLFFFKAPTIGLRTVTVQYGLYGTVCTGKTPVPSRLQIYKLTAVIFTAVNIDSVNFSRITALHGYTGG